MRATLHDELMREAGFESEHYSELERRRERTRQIGTRAALVASAVSAVVAGAVELAVWLGLDPFPDFLAPLFAPALVLAGVYLVVQTIVAAKHLKDRFLQWMEDQI